jgi:hypothetical protein
MTGPDLLGLGVYVAEREIGVDGPIRELYLVSPFDTTDESEHVTEVCWPIFRTAATTSSGQRALQEQEERPARGVAWQHWPVASRERSGTPRLSTATAGVGDAIPAPHR